MGKEGYRFIHLKPTVKTVGYKDNSQKNPSFNPDLQVGGSNDQYQYGL
jgi:hypothetical protein